MATLEKAYELLEQEQRAIAALAERNGTADEVKQYEEDRNVPDYGEPVMRMVFDMRATRMLMQRILGDELEGVVLADEQKIGEYRHNEETGEGENAEWVNSASQVEDTNAAQGQGAIPEGVEVGNAESQVADSESQNLSDEESKDEGDEPSGEENPKEQVK